jgi:hypothetical protein
MRASVVAGPKLIGAIARPCGADALRHDDHTLWRAQNLSFVPNPVWTGIGEGPARCRGREERRGRSTARQRGRQDHQTGKNEPGSPSRASRITLLDGFRRTAGHGRSRAVNHCPRGPQSYDPSVLRPAGPITELVV